MLTLNDIINVSFRKSNFSGYRTEDVDEFIDEVKDSYDALIKKTVEQKEEMESLAEENNQLQKKIAVLAGKIEEYRAEEDEIKSALVSAQKLGEASVREARHKAEIILKEANIKADKIIAGTKQDVIDQQKELERLQKAVNEFRTQLLNIYKEHLTMINAIPVTKVTETEKEAGVLEEEPQEEELTVDETAVQPEVDQEDDFVVKEESQDSPVHDLRYDVLKFEDEFAEEENESPAGIFDRTDS